MSNATNHSKLKFLSLLTLILVFIISYQIFFSHPAQPLKTVAITQIVEHPSLDKVREGIIDGLAKAGYVDGKNIHLVVKNAQGNLVLATQIASQFVDLHPAVMIGIATPSAQSLVSKAAKSDPVVFASITDPVGAKLVPNLQNPGGNVTGTRNASPMDKEIHLIQTILPNVKTIGVILNYSEPNSVETLQALTKAAKAAHLTVNAQGTPSTASLGLVANQLTSQVDALLLMQDNTVASALPVVLKAAAQNHCPVFSTYVEAVEKGALAGLAYDEYSIGEDTAKIVVRILQGENPGSIAVEDPSKLKLVFNEKVAKALNITIPAQLLQQATTIYK